MHSKTGGGEVNWDCVCGASENHSDAVDNLEKGVFRCEMMQRIFRVLIGFGLPYYIRFGSKHAKIH